jgi:hypothetical protein
LSGPEWSDTHVHTLARPKIMPSVIPMSRSKGSKNKPWPENWKPLLDACGGTLGGVAVACGVAAPTAARWRDGGDIYETHQQIIRAFAADRGVTSPI